jgi:hypothetical protein
MDMGKLNVKNGTPVGNEHLCKSCSHALYVTGYRESDVLVICVLTDPSFRVPFVVHQCSDFLDKRKPDWEQMEKLAIEIQPVRVSRKTRGFNLPEVAKPEKPEYEPAAAEVEDEDSEDVDAVAECVLTP